MSGNSCEVLREIELGQLRIEDFAPPDVFTSGLYSRYDVTIADLRWHLFDCSTCAAIAEAGAQLRDFDKERFEALAHILEWADGLVQKRLRWEEDIAEAVGSDMADDAYKRDLGGEAKCSREDLVEAYKYGMFSEVEQKIYCWALKLHAWLGGSVNRWLETLLPPSFPRIWHYAEAGLAGVRINFTEGVSRGQPLPIHAVLPIEAAGPGLRPLLRALLLDEAFGGSVRDTDVVASVREGGKPVAGSGQTPALDWKKFWDHYTAFADMLATAFSTAGPSGVPAEAEQEALQQDTGSRLEDLWQGQTAIMGFFTDLARDISGIKKTLGALIPLRDFPFSKRPLEQLLLAGEGPTLEYKATLRWDLRRNEVNKELQRSIIKTIAGMMNVAGGTLLIGVADDRSVCGIEPDYPTLKKKDRDGFHQVLTQAICDCLGKECATLVSLSFHTKDDKTICVVEIDRSPKPVYLTEGDVAEFYLRTGNTTRPLNTKEAHEYIINHWPGGRPTGSTDD